MNEELPQQLFLSGRLASGVGQGRYFTSLEWFRRQIQASFAFDPAPGTFNLRLRPSDLGERARLERYSGITIVPPDPAFCLGRAFPVLRIRALTEPGLAAPGQQLHPASLGAARPGAVGRRAGHSRRRKLPAGHVGDRCSGELATSSRRR